MSESKKSKVSQAKKTPKEIELEKQSNRIIALKNQNKKIQLKKKRRADSDTVHATLLISGLICAFYGDNIIDIDNQYVPPMTETLRLSNFCMLPFLIFFCYMHYHYTLDIMKIQKKCYYKTTVRTSQYIRKFMIEIFFNIVIMPPNLNIFIDSKIRSDNYIIPLDNYFSVFMMARLYICVRLFKNLSTWTNGRAERICNMNGFEPDGVFALKASLTEKALLWCVILLFGALGVFGLVVRNFEKTYIYDGRTYNFDFMINAFWLQVLTMTTVGYGEIYPVTNNGRFFTIISAIVGIFINSLLTVALTEITELSDEQNNVFDDLIGANMIKTKLRSDAAIFIQLWFKHWRLQANPKRYKVGDRVKARFRYITARNTFVFKRKSYSNDMPSLDEVFDDVNDLTSKYADKFYRKCYKIKHNIMPRLDDCIDHQMDVDVNILKLFDLNQKVYSFLSQCKENEYGAYEIPNYDDIEKVDDMFDLKNRRGDQAFTYQKYKSRLADARRPVADLYDGIIEIDERMKNGKLKLNKTKTTINGDDSP